MHIDQHTSLTTFLMVAPIRTTVYKHSSHVLFNTSDPATTNDAVKLLGLQGLAYNLRQVKGRWYFSVSLKRH